MIDLKLGAAFLAGAILLGATAGDVIGRETLHREAIDRNLAHYDGKTGFFTWREGCAP